MCVCGGGGDSFQCRHDMDVPCWCAPSGQATSARAQHTVDVIKAFWVHTVRKSHQCCVHLYQACGWDVTMQFCNAGDALHKLFKRPRRKQSGHNARLSGSVAAQVARGKGGWWLWRACFPGHMQAAHPQTHSLPTWHIITPGRAVCHRGHAAAVAAGVT